MIKKLYIKNYAIIDEVDIQFESGLTVITGETGSGKSLLLEALSVSLGAKADKIMIRHGSDYTVIETKFDKRLVRRLISKEGKTKSFQNDEPISLKNLKNENAIKVDFHGQYDQQLILNSHSHIDYLDLYCRHKSDVESLEKMYFELAELRSELNLLCKSTQNQNDRLELLNFQKNEIDAVKPLLGEDELLEKKYKRLTNLKNIIQTFQNTQSTINNGNEPMMDQLIMIQQELKSIDKFEPIAGDINELINNAIIQLNEVNTIISSQLLGEDYDTDEIYEIENRITALESLKRKYGGSLDSVLGIQKEIKKEIKELESPEKSENSLREKIIYKEKQFMKKAIAIHKNRKKKSKILSKQIEKTLADLNMNNSKFVVRVETEESDDGYLEYDKKLLSINSKGIDIVKFYFSANIGEPEKPLSLVASGGEISRIMLAIKTVFQELDPVNTLIFDEIDSGISGITAEKVAGHLLKLSKSKQVICITHLSQIANLADHHLHITKYEEDKNTYVDSKYLDDKERFNIIQELFIGKQQAIV